MGRWQVVKTFRVEVGHRLSKHLGKCKNIHGHNLKIMVGVGNHKLDLNDMVIDFALLKDIVSSEVDRWDHALMLNSKDTELIDKFENLKMLVIPTKDPTSEVLCYYLFSALQTRKELIDVRIDFVRIYENDDSYSEYSISY